MKEMTPLEEIRHSTAHVLAAAVLRLYPNTKLDIGPPTDAGFYYDFDSEIAFTPEILEDIEAETVDFIDNFDGSQQEPTVLPSRIPQLLLNGSAGIAVGMATSCRSP